MIQAMSQVEKRNASMFLTVAIIWAAMLMATPAFAQGTWATKAPMPTARSATGAGVINGKLYVVGGCAASCLPSLATNEVYDSVTDTWATKAPMPFARNRLAAGVVNGILYAVGGCADNACGSLLNTNQAYNPVTDTWTTKAPILTARRDFSIVVVNGILYAIGGLTGPGSVGIASVEAYDPVTDSWSTKTAMTTARCCAQADTVNGLIYVVGGTSAAGVSISALEVYNPTTNSWTGKAPMPLPFKASDGAGAINGLLYVVGGDQTGLSQTTRLYNPATDTWSTDAPMPAFLFGFAFGVINCVLHTAGGGDGSGAVFGTTFAFTPSKLCVSIDIKPGSFPNSINLGSNGTVPVAILSAPAPNFFDATTVDPTTVMLAGASVALRGKGTPNASVQDVNGDGLLDLVVHVSTEALQLTGTDTQAILTGQTYGGQTIQGSDSVRIVP